MGSNNKSFFSSVLSTNYGLWTGISSKLEAALNLSLEVLDPSNNSSGISKSFETTSQNTLSSSCAARSNSSTTGCSIINQEKAFHKRRVSQFVAETQNYIHGQKLKVGRKDRSIYGQPEIEKLGNPVSILKSKPSQDSLATDSGHSNCDNSVVSATDISKKKVDPFLVFRHIDSVGIGSESDTCGPSTSVDSSSDVESLAETACCMGRSCSDGSIRSWNSSSSSTDSQGDEAGTEIMEFMKAFVEKIFKESSFITYEEKASFGVYSQQETGRLWFTRYVNAKRVGHKRVPESAFYSLVQYFAIVLFECAEADDFTPAKNLMNMCFTFYNEVSKEGQTPRKQYPYMYLKQQPIWKSLRFWNAAFFDAVQCERAHRHIPTRNDKFGPEELLDEKRFQQNITFGQLGTFTCNMHAFDLNQDLCLGFLKKQCVIANLPKDQVALLRENIDRMYNSEPS